MQWKTEVIQYSYESYSLLLFSLLINPKSPPLAQHRQIRHFRHAKFATLLVSFCWAHSLEFCPLVKYRQIRCIRRFAGTLLLSSFAQISPIDKFTNFCQISLVVLLSKAMAGFRQIYHFHYHSLKSSPLAQYRQICQIFAKSPLSFAFCQKWWPKFVKFSIFVTACISRHLSNARSSIFVIIR